MRVSPSTEVFLSYRRSDSAGHTGRLFDRLSAALGPERVFMDVDSIAPGSDFVDGIEEALASIRVVVVVIGPGWLDASSDGATRRLDEAGDHVRREIEGALRGERSVIPVCVRGAAMPGEEVLPDSIRPLARRSALFVDDDRFEDGAAHLVRVVSDALDERAAVSVAPRVTGNLPAPTSTVVGVEDTVSRCRGLLRSSRLVTLVGAGGCGKTTVALEVGRQAGDRWPAGSWFVPLAAVGGVGAVEAAVAAGLGIELDRSTAASEAIATAIADRELLLILDNCEHVLDEAADLVDVLLARCFGIGVLVTSREPLAMGAETVITIPVLAVPATSADRDGALAAPSVQLFLDRARAADPDLGVADTSIDQVASICRTLDGLPLAIELAAARVRSVPLDELALGLQASVADATGARRAGPAHQRTITAAIDWSYRLMDARLQERFERLAVFRGGFDAEAASAVAELDAVGLEGLVARSLVVSAPSGSGRRFRLLEPLRQFAQERLVAAGRLDDVRDAHVAWMRSLARLADRGLRGPEHAAWVRRFGDERGNLAAAMDRCLETGGSGAVIDVLGDLFLIVNEVPGADVWLDAALRDEALHRDPCRLALAQTLRGWVAIELADVDASAHWTAAALESARDCGDAPTILLSEFTSGTAMRLLGDLQGATEMHRHAAATAESLDDTWWAAAHRYGLGLALTALGDTGEAGDAFQACLAHAVEGEHLGFRSIASMGLGRIALTEGRLDDADRLIDDAMVAITLPLDEAMSWAAVGDVAAARGDDAAVLAACRQGIDLLEGIGATNTGYALAARVASALVRLGRTAGGAELFGSLSMLDWPDAMMGPWGSDPRIEAAIAAVRDRDDAAPSWRAGEAAGPATVVDRARAAIVSEGLEPTSRD